MLLLARSAPITLLLLLLVAGCWSLDAAAGWICSHHLAAAGGGCLLPTQPCPSHHPAEPPALLQQLPASVRVRGSRRRLQHHP